MERDKTLKELEQILAKRQKYVVKQFKQPRRDLGDDPTVGEMYLILATLIKDLQKQKILD